MSPSPYSAAHKPALAPQRPEPSRAERPRVAVLVVAAGNATRFGGDIPKQYLPLRDRALLDHATEHPWADLVLAVIGENHKALYDERVTARANLLPPVIGGSDRQSSVLNGLEALARIDTPPAIVLIHDAARPDQPESVFREVVRAASEVGGAFAALDCTDSLHLINSETGLVERSLPRAQLKRAQTPQGFRFGDILSAHRNAAAVNTAFTDDVAVAIAHGIACTAVTGAAAGEKVTYPEDLPPISTQAKASAIT